MNRLNLGSAYYNALEAVATKRYTQRRDVRGELHVDEARGRSSTSSPTYDASRTAISRATSGGTGWSSRRSSICRSGPARRSAGTRRASSPALIGGWQFNTIGEIQSGRPLGTERQRDPARPRRRAAGERAVVRALVRQQQHVAQQPAAGRHVRVERARPRTTTAQVKAAASTDVNEPTEPQWSFSLFKNNARRPSGSPCSSGSRPSTCSTRASTAGRTPIPTSANFGVVDTASQVNFPRQTQIGVRFQF